MPTVSVILPVRNEEQHLARSLHALLAGTYDSFDIIVVDDDSTDATVEVARSFESSGRVRVLRHERCQGPAAAANLASRQTNADILFFVDGDCEPALDWIEQGVRSLENPEFCAVEGAVVYACTTPTIRHRIPLNPFYNLARRGTLTVPGTDYANGNFAVRRSSFLTAGGFNGKRYPYGREDTDLGLRLLSCGKIAYNPAMRVTHQEEFWTFIDLLRNARRYAADVCLFKDHGEFHFRRGRILHPRFLAELCLPLLILLRYPLHSLEDFLFLPQFYVYLLALRLVIWRTAWRERILVL